MPIYQWYSKCKNVQFLHCPPAVTLRRSATINTPEYRYFALIPDKTQEKLQIIRKSNMQSSFLDHVQHAFKNLNDHFQMRCVFKLSDKIIDLFPSLLKLRIIIHSYIPLNHFSFVMRSYLTTFLTTYPS